MALSTEDRNEIREIIMDNMKGLSATVGAQNTIIESKIDGVHQRLDKINGSVLKHQQDIDEMKSTRDIKYTQIDDYMNNRVTACPHLPAIQALQTEKKIGISKRQLIMTILGIMVAVVTICGGALKISEDIRAKQFNNVQLQDSAMIRNQLIMLVNQEGFKKDNKTMIDNTKK